MSGKAKRALCVPASPAHQSALPVLRKDGDGVDAQY